MVDIRKSAFVQQRSYVPADYDLSQSGVHDRYGHRAIIGRTYGIGSFLNNYAVSVSQMEAVDPLPVLIPIKPFPDPYQDKSRILAKCENDMGKWPCGFRELKEIDSEMHPRPRDWMHNWGEYMYRIGEYGAKTKK